VAATESSWILTATDSGRFSLSFNGQGVLSLACPSVKVQDTEISLCAAAHYSSAVLTNKTRGSDPSLGSYTEQGIIYAPTSGAKAGPAVQLILQSFDSPSRVVHLRLVFDTFVQTNWISPFEGTWSLGESPKEPRFLRVPQDNDVQSSYASVSSKGLLTYSTSNFVTSIYDEASRRGIVIGFLEHDTWKSGVHFRHDSVQAIAGLNGALLTRDYSMPHGMVNATCSPLLSIGFYEDWRDGMEEYARMQRDGNGKPQGQPVPLPTALNLSSGPIAGWNGWAMEVDGSGEQDLPTLLAASDTLAQLRSTGLGPNAIVGRDALYGLNVSETAVWVDHVRSHPGQLAGTYDGIVARYGLPTKAPQYVGCDFQLPCSGPGPECWLANDTLLKDDKGGFIHSLSQPNQFIRDVTHPSFECYLKHSIEQAVGRDKYTLLKQDFLNLAAYEGIRYNMTLCPTGMAAYTRLLQLLADAVQGRALIDYGISLPLPVGPAGHSRHIGCEQMFGGVEYGMNQFAGGWWQNQLYSWLDPDLVTFEGDFWFRPWDKLKFTKMLSMDGQSRVNKAVVFGGIFANGDNLSNRTTAAVAIPLLSNAKVNAMWARTRAGPTGAGTAFRPYSWQGAEGMVFLLSPSVFTRPNGDVAVFNYAPWSKTFTVNLMDAGFLSNATGVVCSDLWRGSELRPDGLSLKVEVLKLSSALLECRE